MPPPPRLRLWLIAGGLLAAMGIAAAFLSASDPLPHAQSGRREDTWTVVGRDFVRSVRLSGTVEAVESTTIAAPRIGQGNTPLVITKLVPSGAAIRRGDVIVEFDRETQLAAALDRRVELKRLDQDIRQREAAERVAAVRNQGEILLAASSLSRARLEMLKNDMLPRVQAEKNRQALAQAEATLKQLRATFDLRRRAARADLQILRIRRARAENAMTEAETNTSKMSVRAAISGIAVLRSIWRPGGMSEVQEGEEVYSGTPIVDIVNPALMRVRANVNQADINVVVVGLPVRIGLDAYPDLFFDGRVSQVPPLATTSALSEKVRTFVALIEVQSSHPNLMPDLTAWVDVELAKEPGVLVVPRDAIRQEADRGVVRVYQGGRFEERAVTLGAMNAHEAVVVSGLEEGAVVERNVNTQGAR